MSSGYVLIINYKIFSL